ncbi:MAG: 2Fe-2S iron-sulfur cluster binding domain-containing protein, partial [Alphaproteobacteria bacterium]|nr:2Fe-2S iron-sulfur cluster binding domain-containing protein [Alphaproteobacteria bacterium]
SLSIMFLEQIAALKDRFLDRLQVFHFLEEEEEEIELFNGRIDAQKCDTIFSRLVDPAAIDAFFICGPGPMMETIEGVLEGRGVPRERILIERFTTGAQSAAAAKAAEALVARAAQRKFTVELDGRRRQVSFDAKAGSILESARAAGLSAPFACKGGVCATCRAKIVSGSAEMKTNYALTPEEVARGYILTCQAAPTSDDLVISYDL